MATLDTKLIGTYEEMFQLFNQHNIRHYQCLETNEPDTTSDYTWEVTIRNNEPQRLSRIKRLSSMIKRLNTIEQEYQNSIGK